LGIFHPFVPSSNVDASTEDILVFNSDGAIWEDTGELSKIEDPKIFIYITSTGKEIEFKFTESNNILTLNLNNLNIPEISNYNILLVLSRTQTVNKLEKGNNFIWISICNEDTDDVILEGYYKDG